VFYQAVQAEVWNDSSSWNQEWENKYQKWIESDSFNKRIFIDPTSPYHGLATDCADVIYAFRIIFSYENKLKYESLNPDIEHLNFFNKYLNNRTNRFDNFQEGPERVKAFIAYLGKLAGTEFLSAKDSYPVGIKNIRPGDFYIANQVVNGITIRHTYLIKKIYHTGVFDLYYSTLPDMVRELKYHRGIPLFSFDSAPYGFRRFINPSMRGQEPSTYQDFSNEQYDLLKKVGPAQIIYSISKSLRVQQETYQDNLTRVIGNICRAIGDRVLDINESINFVDSVNGRCVTKSEYDNLSTPQQDERIYNQINNIMDYWHSVIKAQKISSFTPATIKGMNYLLNIEPSSLKDHQILCSSFKKYPVTLKQFFDRYHARKISSHPNDSIASRWGEEITHTNCQTYY
jgi:hypothetical protein